MGYSRRHLLGMGLTAAALSTASKLGLMSTEALAATGGEEEFWRKVSMQYDQMDTVINLENANWGQMARPVVEAYKKNSERVNTENSFYARREFVQDMDQVMLKTAKALGCDPDEIVFTRNATEALQNLIGGYNQLRSGDVVAYADTDYDSMKRAMAWLKDRRGVRPLKISMPEPATYQGVLDIYDRLLRETPGLKLLLLTHVSHLTGLVIPVKEITAMARERGVDVIVDAAQSWGLLDFKVEDLGADFVGFNLHKWIGAPIGAGLIYIKKDRILDIDPYMGEAPADNSDISKRVHTGTANFAAKITVPDALDFHHMIGAKRKEDRLRSLRDRWAHALGDHAGIQIMTPLEDARCYGGITSFRLAGKTSVEDNKALAEKLITDHNIFTVHRVGLNSGSCIRVTPNVYNSTDDIDAFIHAVKAIAG